MYQTYGTDIALNNVFNTESCIIINSVFRDIVNYPTPQSFQIQLPNSFGNVMSVTLTHFLTIGAFVGPAPASIWVAIDELNPTLVYTPNYPQQGVVFMVPVIFFAGLVEYEANLEFANKCIYPKDKRPNLHTLTIRIYNELGVPQVIPDFIMKLQVRSYY
jgi:hypothetical protein